MRALHNSRNPEYRSPFGAVIPDMPITLAIDVWDAANAQVALRVWIGDEGERIYDMNPVHDGEGAGSADAPVRYQVTIAIEKPCIAWYHFIITDQHGCTKRYGTLDGRMGGEGLLRDWEPPSYQLTVHEPRDAPPAWFEPVMDYLRIDDRERPLAETIETIRENYPIVAYQDELPWDHPDRRREGKKPLSEPSCNFRPVLTHGATPCYEPAQDVFCFWRRDASDNPLCILVNTSLHEGREVDVPMAGESVTELIAGYGVPVSGDPNARESSPAEGQTPSQHNAPSDNVTRVAHVHLHPLGAAILHFHAEHRLQVPMQPGVGVLAHITSIPARGKGTLGKPARSFVDRIAQAGARYWQVLPANPTDEYGSPYAGISAFAGNVNLLEKARCAPDESEYRAFCSREAEWLEPYAKFMAIRKKIGLGIPWQEWPKRYRDYEPGVIEGDEELLAFAEECKKDQFAFEVQWKDLRTYANDRGVKIIGDMPIYVSADSADVWSHPHIFQLDENGLPASVAGCPPDSFAEEGQIWGNPLFDWDALEETDFDWWIRRIERACSLYDLVRLDHFIGFARYFSIPKGCKAKDGRYLPGPRMKLFGKAHELLGDLPLIAEDLGLITPSVRALGATCGFPGMDVAQFVDGNDPLSGYQPRPEKIAYTGTHDNQTLLGYTINRYGAENAKDAAQSILENVATCHADICIFPLQDLIGLGDEARMNTPGVAEGNWTWQAKAADMPAACARLRTLANMKG